MYQQLILSQIIEGRSRSVELRMVMLQERCMGIWIPKLFLDSYKANFKLLIIKRAWETNIHATAQKCHIIEHSVQHCRKEKELLLKGDIQPKNHFVGPCRGILNATGENILEFVLRKT